MLVELHNDMLDSRFGSSENFRLLKELDVELLLDFLFIGTVLSVALLKLNFFNKKGFSTHIE